MRYERSTEPHQHFRCRLCLRLFDVELADPAATGLAAAGFVVEQIAITATGACAECGEYDKGLRAGAKRARRRPSTDLPEGVAATTAETPVGRLMLGATADGVVRSVFEDHGDVPALLRAVDGGAGAGPPAGTSPRRRRRSGRTRRPAGARVHDRLGAARRAGTACVP